MAQAQGLFSFGGLVSGLQTDQIIQKTIDAQSGPLKNLQAQETTVKSQQTAYQTLNTKVQALQTAAQALHYASTFQVTAATSSDSTAIAATASTSATAGDYKVTVNKLASAQQVYTQGVADPNDTTLLTTSNATVTIKLGSTTYNPISIPANTSLNGAAKLINQANLNVSASVLNDGTAYHLVLTSKLTGAANTISVTDTLTKGPITLTELQPASDSQAVIGVGAGKITVTGTTNKLDSVVPGVSLQLKKADPTTAITISVTSDVAAVKKSINDFVTAYNDLNSFFGTAFKYDSSTNATGPLFTDSTAHQLQSDIVDNTTSIVKGGGLNGLGALGITLDKDGNLAVDDTQLTASVTGDLANVQAMFTNTTDGIGYRLNNYLFAAANPFSGVIKLQNQAFAASITDLDKRIQDQKDYLAQQQANLQSEFNAMETALAAFQQQSGALASLGISTSSSSSSSG